MNCSSARLDLHAYLDAELAPVAVLELEAHLLDCAACRLEFEALLGTAETVRGAHGVYDLPPGLRERVAEIIAADVRRRYWRLAAVAAVLLAGFASLLSVRHFGLRDAMTELAVESHLRYARGKLPLDIRSGEPKTVAAWLSQRMPFHLNLPNYPEPSGQQKKYILEGARLLQSENDDVAFLAYRMDSHPISLLMTSSPKIAPTGGDVYYAGGLGFHTKLYKGLRVISWSDKGLNYALVSELATTGAHSCMVCHGSESEHGKFAPLNPKL